MEKVSQTGETTGNHTIESKERKNHVNNNKIEAKKHGEIIIKYMMKTGLQYSRIV